MTAAIKIAVRGRPPAIPVLQILITAHGFSVANLSYQLADEGKVFEYQMTIRVDNRDSYRRLAEALTGREQVLEFHIYPTGD